MATGALAPVSPDTPNRQPQIAAANGVVAMVFTSGKSILYTQSNDEGKTFAKPAAIAELPALMAGRHRGPRVAISGNAIVVSAIGSGKPAAAGVHGGHGGASDAALYAWRSTDKGKTWSKPVVVNDVPGSVREGLHAMAADDKGHVAAVWLDLRAKGTRLYGAFSNDAGVTWSKNVQVYESPDGSICECCHPSLIAAGGEFIAMFRNALGGSRDMYVSKIKVGGASQPASKLGKGTWELKACPMDGGAVAWSGNEAVTAWRRGEEIYFAAEGKPEVRIGAGKDVTLAASGKNVLALWTESGGISSWKSGKTESLAKSGAFATVAGLKDGAFLAAWEENGAIVTRRIE